jgi:hypothetical protein
MHLAVLQYCDEGLHCALFAYSTIVSSPGVSTALFDIEDKFVREAIHPC